MSYTGIKYKQRSIGKMNNENNRHIYGRIKGDYKGCGIGKGGSHKYIVIKIIMAANKTGKQEARKKEGNIGEWKMETN